jgi:hypothetical protein
LWYIDSRPSVYGFKDIMVQSLSCNRVN